MAQAICAELRAVLLERCGPNGIRLAHTAIGQYGDTVEAARAALATLGVRMPDDSFEVLAQSVTTAQGLFNGICGDVHPRRVAVINLAWGMLAKLAELPDTTDALPLTVLRQYYDAHRFPEVASHQLTEQEAIANGTVLHYVADAPS